MQLTLSSHIDSVRLFGVVEETEVARDAADCYLSGPALCGLAPRDAEISGLVVLGRPAVVLRVDAEGGLPKVRPAVVGAVTIDVVNHTNWECTGHPQEGESVCGVSPAVKVDKAIPVDFCACCCFANLYPVASSN